MRNSNQRYTILQLCVATAALVVLALCWPACGDSPAGPDAGNLPPSPGEGSGTLLVVAEVQGRDVSDSVFETEFLATVTDTSGVPVSGSVVISGGFGEVKLAEGLPGSYSALRTGYDTGSYTLRVTSAAGSVSGVTAVAPDVHTITAPTSDQVVEANTALYVRWTREVPAAECRLETRDYDSDWVFGDPGVLYAPSVGNPPRTDQRVRVKRRNVQTPQGALFGSQFSVEIRRTVEPVFAQ